MQKKLLRRSNLLGRLGYNKQINLYFGLNTIINSDAIQDEHGYKLYNLILTSRIFIGLTTIALYQVYLYQVYNMKFTAICVN